MQAMPLGDFTSSASIRASLMVSVFVFPLPGPASTTQCPTDSKAADWPGLSRSSCDAFMYAVRISAERIFYVGYGVSNVRWAFVVVDSRCKPLSKPPLPNSLDILNEAHAVEGFRVGLPCVGSLLGGS